MRATSGTVVGHAERFHTNTIATNTIVATHHTKFMTAV
jgi:hypothetical protein